MNTSSRLGVDLPDWKAAPYTGPGLNKRRTAYIAPAIMIPGVFVSAWTLIALRVINSMPVIRLFTRQ